MSTATDLSMRAEFEGHFAGLAAHSLRFPKCSDCGRFHWYPMPKCPHCGSDALHWQPVSGRGRVWSWTVVRHAFAPALRERLPYVVALVTFDDAPGLRFLTNLVDVDPASIRVGMEVDPVFRREGEDRPQVVFRPAGGAR